MHKSPFGQLTNVRAIAAQCLYQVHFRGNSLSEVFSDQAWRLKNNDVALLKQIVFGSLRWYIKLDFVLKKLIDKPLKTKDIIIHYLLLTGTYQLIYLRTPDYAVVKESVAALSQLQRNWAKGFVNAVLRSVIKNPPDLDDVSIYVENAHPKWLCDFLFQDWQQQQALKIIAANNQQAPLWIRVNQQHISMHDYGLLLQDKKMGYHKPEQPAQALALEQAVAVEDIPGFDTGMVFVQDAAAQMAAELLAPQSGDRVLDACAAPGGKTTHILEIQPQIKDLWAIESNEQRSLQIQDNIKRLCLATNRLQIIHARSENLASWWDGRLFDRILLDAPCSATGVIRRHPDIKLLRKKSDIKQLAALQYDLLKTLWTTLSPGGVLLYATCSVLRQENDLQIQTFIAEHADAVVDNIVLSYGRAMAYGWQIFPGDGDMDGFYYAKIRKISALD